MFSHKNSVIYILNSKLVQILNKLTQKKLTTIRKKKIV